MPPWEFWVWVLAVLACLAGVAVLLLALLHVRYHAAWHGEWTGDLSPPHEGSLRIEFGFPGFMRVWEWKPSPPAPGWADKTKADAPDFATAHKTFDSGETPKNAPRADRDDTEHDGMIRAEAFARDESHTRSGPRLDDAIAARGHDAAAPHAGPASTVPNHGADGGDSRPEKNRKKEKDPHRARKSLFRFFTDRPAWALLIRYGFRVLKLVHRLLRPRVRAAVGHPDPALLGRLAGKWHAAAPLLPLGDTAVNFRFQDRRPSLRLNVEGGFSALSLLFFGVAALGVFPFFGIGRRALRGWRQPTLTGWRAWAYRHIQSL